MKFADSFFLNKDIEALKNGTIKSQSPLYKSQSQFPGDRMFGTNDIEALRAFIRVQKKLRGFQYTFTAGSPANNSFSIPLSGAANFLLGFNIISIINPTTPGSYPFEINLKINNEMVVETVHGAALSPFFMDDEYYSIPRPLTGQDSIILSGDIGITGTIAVTFFYI